MIKEVVTIILSTKSTKKDVVAFLDEMKAILEKEDFNIFSTPYTLLDLDYDISDVVDRLKELTIEEYSETKIDKDNLDPPLLFVFGKNINNKQVYVKLKMKGDQPRHVLCVSFHYAKEKMLFPYA